MPARPTILCVASYFKGDEFLRRAKREGCRVYLLTLADLLLNPWPRDHLDDVFALPSFAETRAVLNGVAYLARTTRFDRVVALDDFDVELGAALREHFRLPGLNASTARLFRDKLAMRVRAAGCGVRVPEFTGTFNNDAVNDFLKRVPPPWLLKPRGQASAAGIVTCRHPDEVWRKLDALGDERSFFVLERMVPGDVYHVDSLVVDGKIVFAEANQYQRPLLEVYHQGSIYATRTVPRDRPEVAELKRANERVLTGFGLTRGPSHTEFLRGSDDGAFYFIETSARVGGANTAEMVAAATGVNLWAEWAKLEAEPGAPYRLPPTHQRYAGVVISLARQERPDTSGFSDPEVVYRLDQKHHIGFVVAADAPGRVEELLDDYTGRIARDHHAALPPAEKVSP
jgi:biotin carboxylase